MNSSSSLLVLGSSHAELPLIDAALRLGCRVATVSSGEPGHAAAVSNEHYKVDYSDVAGVEKLVREANFTSIVAGCNDFAAFTVAQIAENLRMENQDSLWQTEELHRKDRFRRLCNNLGIPSPRFHAVDQSDSFHTEDFENFAFPVIVKPVDMTGGKGIKICENVKQVEFAIKFAISESRSKRAVIEEVIQGQLKSACFFLNDGRPVLLTHADEFVKRDTFLVESALVPSDLPESRTHHLTEYVHRIARDLRLLRGLLHVQFITQGNNDFLIEACRRPPGDLYPLLPSLLAEHELADLVVRNALGHNVVARVTQRPLTPTLRLCLFPSRNGHIRSWKLNQIGGVSVARSIDLRAPSTEIVDSKREKLGIVFFVGHASTLSEIAGDPERALSVNY